MTPEEKQQAFKSLYPQRGKATIYMSQKTEEKGAQKGSKTSLGNHHLNSTQLGTATRQERLTAKAQQEDMIQEV